MRPPHFWSAGLDPESRASAPVTRALLTPLAMLYASASARRIARARPVKVSVPVICIGNLTSGGSGKTPIVEALRTLISAQNINTASLSRGYRGKLKGPLKVEADTHTASQVGDEPLMLAQSGPAWISRDRPAGARAMIASGVETIIMDDGHQNPSLHKDISLLVVDASAPFGNGHVLPKGPLREPIATGLARADGVIMMGPKWTPPLIAQMGLPVFHAKLQRLSLLPTGPLFAFAGIARPERFFESLRADGANVCDSISYSDHQAFTPKTLKNLRALAQKHGATLVTTEKDFIRIDADDRHGIIPIKVRAVFENQAALMEMVNTRLQEPAG